MVDIINEYDSYQREVRRRSPRTLGNYLPVIREFFSVVTPTGGASTAEQLRSVDKAAILTFLRRHSPSSNPSTPTQWNLRLAAVRSLFNYLVESEIVTANVALQLERQRVWSKERVPLSFDELIRLVDAVREHSEPAYRARNVAIVLTLIHTALRVAEIVSLNVNQVDFEHNLLLDVRAKGGKLLAVVLNDVVTDRQHLAEITREKQIGANDPGAGYGQVLGAAALVFGRVTRNGYTENITADEQACLQGGKSFPCTTYTRTGTHNMSVNFKVVDAGTGKILATKIVNGTASGKRDVQVMDAKSTNPQVVARIVPPLDNPGAYRDGAIGDIVDDFMKMIAPYTVMVSVVLYEQDSQTSKMGVNAAKAGNWATAIENFKSALGEASASPDLEVQARAHYNLGVAFGYSGSYDAGLAEIQKATMIKADDVYQREIQSIRVFQADDAKLKAQAG